MLQCWLLGQFELKLDGRRVVLSARAAQSLLAYLMLTAGTRHRREKLAALFWSELPEENAQRNLRHEVWRIRKALVSAAAPNAEYLLAEERTLTFNKDAEYWLDAAQFQKSETDLEALISNLSNYRGELLPGMYDDWVSLERDHLQAIFENKMQLLLEKLIEAQRWNSVIDWGERWVAEGRTPEPSYRALMVAYAATGNRSQVFVTYERCQTDLKKELGVEPSDETQVLYQDILRGKQIGQINLTPMSFAPVRLPFHEEPPAPGEPPFKGLEFFDEEDAALFFGREELTARLVQEFRADKFLVVVVGASGSGKSSLVRAGVVPALRRASAEVTTERFYSNVYILTPTAHPLEAIAAALTLATEPVTATASLIDVLAKDPRGLHLRLGQLAREEQQNKAAGHSSSAFQHVLLVIDQFEELFTLCHDEFEREAFIDNLLTALSYGLDGALTVILTLRADFYAHLAQYAELRETVAKHQEFIGPMTTDELRRAIEEPAKREGWKFEAGLVDLMLRDVGDEPGALPLLSHVLLETWKRRSGHVMTLKGYADAGGVHGAISQTAEITYQQLTPQEQNIARTIFLRLTELGQGTEDTRRSASFEELVPLGSDRSAVRAVLGHLADARLVTAGESTAQVAHEALIREWPRLREWLNEDRAGLQLHRHLTETALEWELMERDADVLYRGARLVQAQEFVTNNPAALNAQESTFLAASAANAVKEEQEKVDQQQRELLGTKKLVETQTRAAKQLQQRAMFLAGSLILALVLAGIALFFSYSANRNAMASEQNSQNEQEARAEAEKQRRLATARELAANALANLEVDAERSILLALQAVETTREVDGTVLREAEEALHRAVQASRILHTIPILGSPEQIAFSPDETQMAIRGKEEIWILDVGTRKQRLALPISSGYTDHIYFSGDGKRLATLDVPTRGTISLKIFDLQTGIVLREIPLPILSIDRTHSVLNQDWTRLVVSTANGIALAYDLQTEKLLFTLYGHTSGLYDIAYSPDGKRLATASVDGTAKVWDAETGKELLTLNGHSGAILAIDFSLDSTRVATASQDRTAKVWNARTGQEISTLTGHHDWVLKAVFGANADQLATISLDGKAKVWDGQTGNVLTTLGGHGTNGEGLAFYHDGTRLATSGADGTVEIWDLTPGHEALTLPTGGPLSTLWWAKGTVAYRPDGKYFAVGFRDGRIKIWDALTGQEEMVLEGHTDGVNLIAFSKDGSLLVSASSDKTAKVWQAVTGTLLVTLIGHSDGIGKIAISPNGKQVATASQDFTVKLWDASSGNVVTTFTSTPPSLGLSVAFSPDGSRLITTFGDGSVSSWDLASGKAIFKVYPHEIGVNNMAYSPDGSRLALSGDTLASGVVDAATGKTVATLGDVGITAHHIAYSPDGTRLATAHVDGTVRVWDATTGQEQLTLYGKPLFIQSVAFSPDGTRLAFATDEEIRVYFIRVQDLVALAKTRVTRSLTSEECSRFLHRDVCPK